MTSNDDILVSSFLKAEKKEIADNGFSRRVMRRLPIRSRRLIIMWQLTCILAALVVFLINDGWHVLERSFTSIAYGLSLDALGTMNIRTMLIGWCVVSAIGAYTFLETQMKD